MLEYKRPLPAKVNLQQVVEIGDAYRAAAREHFLAYRHLIDPTLVPGWSAWCWDGWPSKATGGGR